jgi:hypothetical protein
MDPQKLVAAGGSGVRIVMLDSVNIKPIFWRPLSHQR